MKNIIYIFTLLLCLGCQKNIERSQNANEYNVIPLPSIIIPEKDVFSIGINTEIHTAKTLEQIKFFAEKLILSSKEESTTQKKNSIHFKISNSFTNEEAYSISVKPNEIIVESKTGNGAFYAIQTLKQLKQGNTIPCVQIMDQPRFTYRGMHLDVSRHFFPISVIKKYIDQLAFHKINRFHWHLTDDQGWRIEIKKYPKLQEISAFRNETLIGHYNDNPQKFDGKPYGGFYTQEEVKEIVKYAQDRYVTVIPEIEMPGHSLAVLAAYPELGCTTGPFETGTKWGVFDDVFCPKEETFEFLENVLMEVIDLFPSKLIHIGGDECPKTKWNESAFCQKLIKKEGLKDSNELQSYFIQRIERFLNSKGRNIIGWDEILEGGLAPNAAVMSWRGEKGGIEAAKQKHNVVMTPTTFCYFDYYQSPNKDEPIAIGGLLSLKKVYSYNPIPDVLTPEEAKYIMGVQANIWTEYISTPEKLEYMMFPRVTALAEIAWTEQENRDYKNFTSRLIPHLKKLKEMGVNSANHLFDVTLSIDAGEGNEVTATLENDANSGNIHYTLDGSTPNLKSPSYIEPIKIKGTNALIAQSFIDGQAAGKSINETFAKNLAAGKKITFAAPPHPKYNGNGIGSLTNGLIGASERYGGNEWFGFEGKDAECIIDFGIPTDFNNIKMHFFNGIGQWIYLPKMIEIWTSDDGENFTKIAEKKDIFGSEKVIKTSISLKKSKKQFLKIKATNFGEIPAGEQGAGHNAWLFLDEILVTG